MGSSTQADRGFSHQRIPSAATLGVCAADDFDSTGELVSVIRGRGGTGQMYGPGDALPAVYSDRFTTPLYSERVKHPGVWNKQVVVAHEGDFATMLSSRVSDETRLEPLGKEAE